MVFLSTSRVYPIDPLRQLPFEVRGQRFVVPSDAAGPGWSEAGVSTDFPLQGNRSMYGVTKLCSELLIQEYGAMYGLRAVVNRCSVVAGPWQMGKVDQGFVVLWAARHLYGGALSYIGFGGQGRQVRDVLHVEDLYDLINLQLADLEHHAGQVYNVGGGPERSVSLAEMTELCTAKAPPWGATDRLSVGSVPDTGPADIPYYVTDNKAVTAATSWHPKRSLEAVLDEIFQWLHDERAQLEPILK
jgi:CDP-paratose 2-epimerase